jgi:acetylornithine deacetylase
MRRLTRSERHVVDEIATRQEDLVALLIALIGYDTRAPDPDFAPREDAALQEHLAERLRGAGCSVRLWEPDTAALAVQRYVRPAGHHFRSRPQLLARARGRGGGRSLQFNGHIDVVRADPVELWTSDPFTGVVRDGRVYGRGACDMKGGVAAMVVAAETLLELGVGLRGDLLVNTVTDEESTGLGSLASATDGARADGGIIPEPTRLTGWLGTRGSLMPEITVEGRAGHAGYPHDPAEPDPPVNAIEKMQVVLAAIQRLSDEWQSRPDTQHPYLKPGMIVPTSIDAGQWIVSYPARCTLRCHVQYVPQQADADGWGTLVEREIEARVREAAAQDPWLAAHPPAFRWPGDVPPGFHGPEEPISAVTLDAMSALGLAPEIASRTTFFDGPTFSRAGTPTIAFGPGDIAVAHAVDEYVPIDELVRAAQLLAVAAMRFCGVEEH